MYSGLRYKCICTRDLIQLSKKVIRASQCVLIVSWFHYSAVLCIVRPVLRLLLAPRGHMPVIVTGHVLMCRLSPWCLPRPRRPPRRPARRMGRVAAR